jgi:prophage antirepressor-like protein
MRSTRPEAKAFQDWVSKVVLPSIRKTGSFVTGHSVKGFTRTHLASKAVADNNIIGIHL